MINVYLAAPIVNTNDETKVQISYVKDVLELLSSEIKLYDPKEHGVPNAWGISMQEWCRCIFALDVVAIDNSDWVVVCDYGRKGTAGTAWECGYAFGKGKKVLVIQMVDVDVDYSVMMRGCSANYCTLEEFLGTAPKDVINKYFIERGRLSQTETLN